MGSADPLGPGRRGLDGPVGDGVAPGGAEPVGDGLPESVGVGWAVIVVVGDGIEVSVGDGLGPPMIVAPVVCLARGTHRAAPGTRKPAMSTTPR